MEQKIKVILRSNELGLKQFADEIIPNIEVFEGDTFSTALNGFIMKYMSRDDLTSAKFAMALNKVLNEDYVLRNPLNISLDINSKVSDYAEKGPDSNLYACISISAKKKSQEKTKKESDEYVGSIDDMFTQWDENSKKGKNPKESAVTPSNYKKNGHLSLGEKGEIDKREIEEPELVPYKNQMIPRQEYKAVLEIASQINLKPEDLEKIVNYDKNAGVEVLEGHVVKLQIQKYELKQIPESIGNLKELLALDLGNNRLTYLPEIIGELKELQWLGLNNNELTSLPEIIGELKELQWLGLDYNYLTSVPESIGNLIKLQVLGLNNNELTSLPEIIGELKELQKLCLRANQLTSLPKSIGNLIKLQELWLQNNRLTYLPEAIGNLGKLQKLWLMGNYLTSIPESTGNLIKLQELDLHNNHLKNIPKWLKELARKNVAQW